MKLFLLLFPSVIGLSVVSKTDWSSSVNTAASDRESNELTFILPTIKPKSSGRHNKTRIKESYIPVIVKRNNKDIAARIPVLIGNKTERATDRRKSTSSERPVPIVRGAAVPSRSDLQDLPSANIEGLHPPSQTAVESWDDVEKQSLKYPDSNGYYPNVEGDERYPTTSPRPIYGVPPTPFPNPNPGPWGCMAPWGGEKYPTDRPYYPTQPPSNGPNPYPSPYPPSAGCPPQGNYPPTRCPNYGCCGSSQGTGNNWGGSSGGSNGWNGGSNSWGGSSSGGSNSWGGSSGGSNGWSSSGGSSGGSNGWGSSGGPSGGSNGWGSSGGPSGGSNGWGSSSGNTGWRNSARPWSAKQEGRWVPCGPFDLKDLDGRRRSTGGCPPTARLSSAVRFEAEATPASKVDDKNNFFRDAGKDAVKIKK